MCAGCERLRARSVWPSAWDGPSGAVSVSTTASPSSIRLPSPRHVHRSWTWSFRSGGGLAAPFSGLPSALSLLRRCRARSRLSRGSITGCCAWPAGVVLPIRWPAADPAVSTGSQPERLRSPRQVWADESREPAADQDVQARFGVVRCPDEFVATLGDDASVISGRPAAFGVWRLRGYRWQPWRLASGRWDGCRSARLRWACGSVVPGVSAMWDAGSADEWRGVRPRPAGADRPPMFPVSR